VRQIGHLQRIIRCTVNKIWNGRSLVNIHPVCYFSCWRYIRFELCRKERVRIFMWLCATVLNTKGSLTGFPTAHAPCVGLCLNMRQANPFRTVDFFFPTSLVTVYLQFCNTGFVRWACFISCSGRFLFGLC